MKKLSKRKLNTLLKDLIDKLEQEHKDNFTGLVLFGSYAKNKATDTSDIDLIITFKKLPKTRFERVELIEDDLNNLEFKYKVPINPIIKQDNELKINFLFADITDYAKIYVDKNKKINILFKKIDERYQNETIKKIISGDHYRLYIENV